MITPHKDSPEARDLATQISMFADEMCRFRQTQARIRDLEMECDRRREKMTVLRDAIVDLATSDAAPSARFNYGRQHIIVERRTRSVVIEEAHQL
jgi:hypothetical protein